VLEAAGQVTLEHCGAILDERVAADADRTAAGQGILVDREAPPAGLGLPVATPSSDAQETSGFRIVSSGNRVKSRSADQSSETP
jgi:hypothetical protein